MLARHTLFSPILTRKRHGFHKLVLAVNEDYANGYAFSIGMFIPDGVEVDLPIGGIMVRKIPIGPVTRPSATWAYAHVPNHGETWEWSKEYSAKQFLTFRDIVAIAVDESDSHTFFTEMGHVIR